MSDKLAPAFLVAPFNLIDPHFGQSVVLLASHEAEGSMGFIINRPTNLSLHQLLKDIAITPTVKDQPVLFGGPVSSSSGFVLYRHRRRKPLGPGIMLSDYLSVSPSKDLLELAALGKLSGRFELLLGYSGWAKGQLNKELRQGGWLLTPYAPDLVFGTPIANRWEESFQQLGVSPLGFTHVPGGAQA